MSTQLILYPQYYQGFNSINFTSNEFIVDGNGFTSINASASYSTTGSIDNHLYTTPPAIINTWYRWRNTASGTPAYPIETSGNLVLNSVTPSSISGVYQKLSNLIAGASYTLTVNMTAVAGIINLKAFNLSTNSVIAGQLLTSNTTQQSLTFIAQTTTDTIAVLFYNDAAANLTISSISVSPTGQAPTQVYSDLNDGQVICDLYQEEDIPLTLSIDDFKNVAEKVQSYSKDFNLPATKRNNRIFNNMFEVTRADDGIIFNPYVRTKCVLKQDGFILFEGYLRLINVKDKEGEISYNVNLYSEVIALADVLKDATFSDLDFTELTHEYNKTQIKSSWNDGVSAGQTTPITWTNPSTSGFRTDFNTLKYPFIDWTGNIPIAAAGGTPTAGNPQLTTLEQAFRPCIQLKYLINRIFAASGFNFTSNFFNSADFENLYMDFNYGNNELIIGIGKQSYSAFGDPITTSAAFPTWTNLRVYPHNPSYPLSDVGYDDTTGILTATANGSAYTVQYSFSLNRTIGGAASFRWVHKDALGNEIDVKDFIPSVSYNTAPYTSSAPLVYSGFFTIALQANETLEPQFLTLVAGGLKQKNWTSYCTFGLNPSIITTNTLLQTLRGKLGQWDFLKGIMTMFNLVSMVDENDPDNILIEPYSDVFINNTNSGTTSDLTLAARSIEHDWTGKVDVSQMDLKPLTDLNKETIFKFAEDDDDFAFNLYKRTTGKRYGSKEFDASSIIISPGQSTLLEGKKEIIAEPFAATVSKPLYQQFPNFIVPCVYSETDDGSFEGFDNSPRIFYNNGKISTGASYYIPSQNDLFSENQEFFLQFSHLSTIPTQVTIPPASTDTIDFYFGSYGYIQPIGTMAVDNLYSLYWQPYFNELYNPDTRTMTLKVNLTPADINTFKFYDIVFIKNRSFRVNKIDYKPNDLATVEFILIP